MSELFPKVLQVLPGENYVVYAYMNDGSVRYLDMRPMIEKGGVFERLRDERFFGERLSVINDTVAWDVSGNYDPATCIDLDPFMIQGLPAVRDPKEREVS